MSSLYVAGPSAELDRVRRAIAAARERGHAITLDWTDHIETTRAAGLTDRDLSPRTQALYAEADLDAIRAADAVLLLVGAEGLSSGSAVELGLSIALGKLVVATGTVEARRRCIFVSLCAGQAESDAAGLALIEHLLGGRRA